MDEENVLPEDQQGPPAPAQPDSPPDATTETPDTTEQQGPVQQQGPAAPEQVSNQGGATADLPGINGPTQEPSVLNVPDPQQGVQELSTESSALQNDLATAKIAPQTVRQLLWNNPDGTPKDFLGKTQTLFALALSGIGSGLTHQPNALLGMLDKEVQNNMQAQQQQVTQKQNLFHLLQQNELNKAQIKTQLTTQNLQNSGAMLNNAQALTQPTVAAFNTANTALANADARAKTFANQQAFTYSALTDKFAKDTADMPDNNPDGSPNTVKMQRQQQGIMLAAHANDKIMAAQAEYQANMNATNTILGIQPNPTNDINIEQSNRDAILRNVAKNPGLADEWKKRFIPNVGWATKDVSQQLPAINASQNLIAGVKQLQNYLAQAGPLDPANPQKYIPARNMAAGLVPLWEQARQAGVIDSKSVIPQDPDVLLKSWRSLPQINTSAQQAQQFYANQLYQAGIKVQNNQPLPGVPTPYQPPTPTPAGGSAPNPTPETHADGTSAGTAPDGRPLVWFGNVKYIKKVANE